MFIVRPDMTEEDLDKLIATLSGVVAPSGGSVQKVDKMGKRRLAYTVRRFHEGIYVLMVVEGGGAVIHELERRLRVTEPVIKFLTVRTDEEQKRLDKIKALRDAQQESERAACGSGSCGGGSTRGSGSSGGSSGDGVGWRAGFGTMSAKSRFHRHVLAACAAAERLGMTRLFLARRNDTAILSHASGLQGHSNDQWPTNFRGELWLKRQKQQSIRRRVRGRGRAEIVRLGIVRGLAAVVDAGPVVLREKAAGDASFSGARKSASSASRKLKTSTTRITACSASSWPRAARLCRGA